MDEDVQVGISFVFSSPVDGIGQSALGGIAVVPTANAIHPREITRKIAHHRFALLCSSSSQSHSLVS
jgi:hypothetical protein